MILNSHLHVNTDENFFFYSDYSLEKLLREMNENHIDLALPTLNPKVNIFRCPNDCSVNCKITCSINNDLQSCNCISPARHRINITQNSSLLILKCKICRTATLQTPIDPLRKFNEDLIKLTRKYRERLRPSLYLSLSEATLQNEINYFEENYSNEFVGFKFHPWNDGVSVANFKIKCSKPILIHTGIREIESPINAIKFAQNNPDVKIVIAHAAGLKPECLKEIAQLKNIYIDCCPSVFMYKDRFSCLYSPERILQPEDIYYTVFNIIPDDKILFGSDSPWGNTADELDVISRLQISKEVKEKILFQNAFNLYF